jgi:putative YphP/YqiW family bacilliredoxin
MFTINHKAPIYDPVAVQPMRDELIFVGFKETTTPQQIDESLGQKNDQTVLVVINSVCGCSAGSARPGVTDALQNNIIPDQLITIFAGQDREAVDHLRENYLKDIPPSSPFIALFKNGEPIHILPRHRIEGRYAEEITEELIKLFNENCSKQGPSVTPEKYKELIHAKACGSKIPLNN